MLINIVRERLCLVVSAATLSPSLDSGSLSPRSPFHYRFSNPTLGGCWPACPLRSILKIPVFVQIQPLTFSILIGFLPKLINKEWKVWDKERVSSTVLRKAFGSYRIHIGAGTLGVWIMRTAKCHFCQLNPFCYLKGHRAPRRGLGQLCCFLV